MILLIIKGTIPEAARGAARFRVPLRFLGRPRAIQGFPEVVTAETSCTYGVQVRKWFGVLGRAPYPTGTLLFFREKCEHTNLGDVPHMIRIGDPIWIYDFYSVHKRIVPPAKAWLKTRVRALYRDGMIYDAPWTMDGKSFVRYTDENRSWKRARILVA